MIKLITLICLFAVINPFWGKSLHIFGSGQSLFRLVRSSFSYFDFPRWQSAFAITLIGILVGLDPNIRTPPPNMPNMPAMPLWFVIPASVLSVWAAFLVIVSILRWWMKRDGRWDGQGDLFNLVAASWLVANVLGVGLVALNVPPLLTLPLWLYSVWVGANALSGAIPKASLGYSIGGIVISLIPAMLTSGIVFALSGIIMGMLGLMPAPAPVGAG